MKHKPSLDLFRHNKSGGFVLLNHTIDRDSGMRVASGDLVRIGASDMQEKGMTLILESLKQFSSRDNVGVCELQKMTPSQRSRFHSQHSSVSIWLDSPKDLVIQAMKKVKAGGAVGQPEHRLSVRLPMSNSALFRLINEAFAEAD
jgi:hypothetical protein